MKTKVEEIIESISIDRSNLEYIAVTGKINGSLYISIKKAMEEYANQFKYDYSKTCKCGDDSTGETWCCDICGLPTVKHSKKNRPQQIIDKRRVWLAENSIEDWNDFDTNVCMQIYSNQENKELFDKLKTVSASLKEDKWISVEERLPNIEPKRTSSDWVLTFDKENCRIDKAFFSEVTGWQAEHGEKMFVTCWRELPEPPTPPKAEK